MAEKLPEEILSYIFSYLTLTDKLQCRLVCKGWQFAFLDPRLHEKTFISFVENDEGLLTAIYGGLLDSNVPGSVRKIHFEKVEVGIFVLRPIIDWVSLLSSLTHFSIDTAPILNETELVLLLKQLTNLTNLAIVNAREVLISGGFLSHDIDRKDIRESLVHVTSLNLSSNSPYLSDLLFNRILECIPNVQNLTLANINILSHSGIYKKYYPESVRHFNSPSVLTLRNIVRFVSERRLYLKSLNFYNSNISSAGFQEIGLLEGLDLKSINVGKCLDISQEAILQFCQRQQNLVDVNIDHCRKILMDNPATCLSLFGTWSKSLRHLSMKGLSAPREMKNCFQQLDRLKSLTVAECDIPSRHILEGLQYNVQHLSFLNMNSLAISCPQSLVDLAPSLSSLSHIELRNEHAAVTDTVIQAIIKSCKHLSVLILNNCTQLTDYGFIGISSEETKTIPNDSSDVGFQRCEDPISNRIFLGSKAEAELRQDIRRLNHLEHMDLNVSDGSGINGLRSLTRLELENVKITEISLSMFDFEHLRSINLSLCKSICDSGFRYLAVKNPSIENFVAKQTSITDETVLTITKNCKRLVKLDVEGCQGITNTSVSQLPDHCSLLKYLDVSFCKKVKTMTLQKIQKEMRLKAVGMRGLAIAELLDSSDDDTDTDKQPMMTVTVPPPPPLPN